MHTHSTLHALSVYSGSASWDDCGRMFPDEIRVSSFRDRIPHNAWTVLSSHSDFDDFCVFMCNVPPALLAKWFGSFTCHCGNTEVERTPNKSQHTKITLEKKIFLPGFELAIFRSRYRRSTNKPSRLPWDCNIQEPTKCLSIDLSMFLCIYHQLSVFVSALVQQTRESKNHACMCLYLHVCM